MHIFDQEKGIIIACDVKKMNDLINLIESTSYMEGIVGYKIGATIALKYGLSDVMNEISSHTDLPVIYDHQKFGTDIPDICVEMLNVYKDAGIRAIIIFPLSGLETLRAAVDASFDLGMIPIVGGEMTHEKYLSSDSGYISEPERIYLDAAKLRVEYFVIPGKKLDKMEKYRSLICERVKDPKFIFPGIGYQGGNIKDAFEVISPFPRYPIVGRAIYEAKDVRDAARRFVELLYDH
jgi:orotidine-5'-phosphate decarboxylase